MGAKGVDDAGQGGGGGHSGSAFGVYMPLVLKCSGSLSPKVFRHKLQEGLHAATETQSLPKVKICKK